MILTCVNHFSLFPLHFFFPSLTKGNYILMYQNQIIIISFCIQFLFNTYARSRRSLVVVNRFNSHICRFKSWSLSLLCYVIIFDSLMLQCCVRKHLCSDIYDINTIIKYFLIKKLKKNRGDNLSYSALMVSQFEYGRNFLVLIGTAGMGKIFLLWM